MIRLYIAEKPSVGRDLAKVLGANRRVGDHLEGQGVWVAWCIGHLVSVAPPDAHDPRWKRWHNDLLPMLPETLKLQPIRKTSKHFRGLAKLLNDRRVGQVVNACDAGREGELIFRYVYQLARCTKPTLRFWVASLTPQAIRTGLSNLRPGRDYDPLADAARCRAEADWLVGMNGTRGLTGLGGTLLSVGRVQTPTLAIVTEREREIEAFVPTTYWEVTAKLRAENGGWKARWIGCVGAAPPKGSSPQGRLPTAQAAEKVAVAIRGSDGVVSAAEHQRQSTPPPRLHHLTSLQQAANRRFGMTAKRTLQTAQALYEKHKLLTYPRTDSRYLTRDVAAGMGRVVAGVAVGPYAPFCAEIQRDGLPRLSRRFVDNAKVGDHHAIIPTGKAPNLNRLSADEQRVFDLVVRQLLGAHYPPAVYAKTRLEAQVAGHRLEARGRVRIEPGWELVNPPASPKKPNRTEAVVELPPVAVEDAVRAETASVERKETRPPKRYTEASLLGAMENAGRRLDEAELRAAMREGGLGTPATRAATIETLLQRQYLQRRGRHLVPAPAGRALLSALPVEALKNPRLTGEWEARLQKIADGQAQADAFRQDIRDFVCDVVKALKAAPEVAIPGPKRFKGRAGKRGAQRRGSTRKADRAGPRWAKAATRAMPAAQPKGQAARARRGSDKPRCPKCRQGDVIRGNRGWGCTRWRQGCRFVVTFQQNGVTVPDDEADRLFRRGQTRLFTRRPSDGRKVRLVLDLDADGNVIWQETRRGQPTKVKG